MPDGLQINGIGAAKAAGRFRAMADRTPDLSRATKFVAAEIDKLTSDAFRSSRSPAGEAFPRLAPSTVAARARKLPGASRRSKKTGKLTKKASDIRGASRELYAAGGGSKLFTPLIDTGRARNSAHATGHATGVTWSAVKYLAPHITGSEVLVRRGLLPKRNVSVFEKQGGIFLPIPKVKSLLLSSVARYLTTGRVR